MDSRKLAALLSSLICQLLLLLLFPTSSAPISLTSNSNFNFHFDSNSYANLFPLISHFLSSQQIASSLSLLSVRKKRKRTHFPEPQSEHTDEPKSPKLGTRLGLPRTPDSFKTCFKMTSSTFDWLSGLLEPLLECRDPIGSPFNLSAEVRLGIGLYRLATGSNFAEIAQRFGVSEAISRFCAKQLCRVLCTNFRFWVAFPSPNELESVSNAFESLAGLPNCCGVVDCIRFKILKNKESEDSIAAQIVVDSSSRILSIVAGFRGDKSDSRVLKSSTFYKDIEERKLLNLNPINVHGVDVNQYLIGDREYPLLPWLMVPYVDALPGSKEANFNEAHSLMRVSGLKTIASLKNWGVLSVPMEEDIKVAVAYIGACSILHNALLMREDYSALCDESGDFSVHDQSSESCWDANLEDNSIEKKASEIRSALAVRAKDFCASSSVPLQPK